MSYIRTKFIYFSVTLIILLPLIFLSVYDGISHRDKDIEERRRDAAYITRHMGEMLMDADPTEYGSIIESISHLFPEFTIGFYTLAERKIDRYYGKADMAKLQTWLTALESAGPAAGQQVYETRNEIRIAQYIDDDEHQGGYLFVHTSIQDIRRRFTLDNLIATTAILMILILTLLMIRALAARYNHALDILSYQIQIDEEHQDDMPVYPDIKPILERINRKNSDLRNMAQKYINEAYKMKQLMDMTPLGILSIDERGTIIACNATYAQFHPDIDNERLLGMNIRVLAEQSRIPEVELSIEQALSGFSTNAHTLEYEQRVLLIYAYPIYDEKHEITGALGICQDITELEKLRNELHRMDRLHIIGQMAASFAHEVRNPLTVIRGFMQLMQQQQAPDKMQDYLQMVISELDRSNEIIGNFLSLSQNRFLQKNKMSLNQIIEEIEALLEAEANHSNIELHIEKDPALQELMLNDKEIKQLILNLTRNGIESMKTGGSLYIRTIQQNSMTILEVQDSGHGIPQDKLSQLFEPFYTTKPSGTGLGLAVCLSIVERHHARIHVASQENVGTTFTIVFDVTEEKNRRQA